MDDHAIREAQRVAVATIDGYRFQVLHTIRTWLTIDDDRFIIAEGNEDIDHIFLDGRRIEEQIKLLSDTVGQRDVTVVETVLNYLKAFVYHDQSAHPFLGILRTTARIATRPTTEIGKWIAGKTFSRRQFTKELEELANDPEDDYDYTQELAYLRKKGKRAAFLASVEWADADAGPAELEEEIEGLLEARASSVPVGLTSPALQAYVLSVLSKREVEHRVLRRVDADIVISGVALEHALNVSRVANAIQWTATLWSIQGPPSVAVALFVRDRSAFEGAVRAVIQNDRAARRPRDLSTLLREEVRGLDFIAYASRRMHTGGRGERVCVYDVVKQSNYRFTPREAVISATAPPWLDEYVAKRWPAPVRTAAESGDGVLLVLSRLVAEAVINDEQQAGFLRSIESKLRWVHDIRIGDGVFFTAENPLR